MQHEQRFNAEQTDSLEAFVLLLWKTGWEELGYIWFTLVPRPERNLK